MIPTSFLFSDVVEIKASGENPWKPTYEIQDGRHGGEGGNAYCKLVIMTCAVFSV